MFRMKNKTLSALEADKIKRNFWTYAILISALGAMVFFGVCDPSNRRYGGKGGSSAAGHAATVGGEVISRSEFNRAYQRQYQQYQRMYQDAFDPQALQLAHNVMKELIDDRAMYMKAVDLGMKASDDEVIDILKKEEVFKGENGKFSDEVFARFLESNGHTEASFMDDVRRSVSLQKLRRFISETSYVSSKAAAIDYRLAETKLDLEYLKFDPQKIDVKVTPEEVTKFLADEKGKARVKEYFDTNAKEFNQAEQVKARHILVSFKGARSASVEGQKRDKAQAQKRADELLAKVKAPGADFAQIAKDSTDEPSGKTSGGDLGFFTRETMDKAFSDVAFAMNKGEISKVVESPFGFHIIKVEDKKAAVATKLDEAQNKIAETLLMKEKRPALAKERADKVLAALNAKQPVDALLTEDKVAWAATGEVQADAKYLPGIGSSKEVTDALSGLTAVGQIYPTAVDVRGNLYVLKLKSRKDPDMSKFSKEKQKEMSQTAAYTEGTSLFTSYEKQVRDELEKKQKVWQNPDFLAMDDAKTKGKDQDNSGG